MEYQEVALHQTIKRANEHQILKGSKEIFTGEVKIKPLTDTTREINASSAYVSFSPNARSYWHTHPKGQYLIVTEGEGFVQEWGKPAQRISIGDVIHCPPGIKHWHGANGKVMMTHLSIAGSDENGKNVDWLEPVSDEQFNQASK